MRTISMLLSQEIPGQVCFKIQGLGVLWNVCRITFLGCLILLRGSWAFWERVSGFKRVLDLMT